MGVQRLDRAWDQCHPLPRLDEGRQGAPLVHGVPDVRCEAGRRADGTGHRTAAAPGGAHLDLDAGYGPWPAVLDWCLA